MSWILRPFFILILFGLLKQSESPYAKASELKLSCAPNTLVHRTGRERCWAEYSLSSSRKLCVPHPLWLEWLRQKSTLPLCAKDESRWKVRSPLLNQRSSVAKLSWKTQTLQTLSQTSSPLVTARTSRWVRYFLKITERKREELSQKIAPYDRLGVARSLVLDERMPNSPVPLLRQLGFVHLASASGIHLYALGAWIDRSVIFLCRPLGVPVGFALALSRAAALVSCAFVWVLAGGRLGLLRPALVILIKEAAARLGLRWLRFYPLLVALLLEFFLATLRSQQTGQPITQSGRWIYALAIGGGMMGFHFFSNHPTARSTTLGTPLRSHLGLALGSWVTVALWEVWETGALAVATAPLSLLTLPIVCTGLYPALLLSILLSFLGLPGLSTSALEYSTAALTAFLMPLLQISLQSEVFNLWMIPNSALLAGLVCGFALTFLTFKRASDLSPIFMTPLKTVALGVVAVAFVWKTIHAQAPPVSPPSLNSFRTKDFLSAEKVEQLDVGQGDSSLVHYLEPVAPFRTVPKWGLIDSGSFHSLSDTAWLQLFFYRGIHRLSWVALTHLDEDHTGGLLRLARLIPVDCVATSEAELRTARGVRFTQELFNYGIRVKAWTHRQVPGPCIPFPILGPLEGPEDRTANARMSALWIPLRRGGFYLSAGDATETHEKRIAQWVTQLPQTPGPRILRILKISHHGSKTSTAPELLNQLKPTEAWISVGVGNSYGHPHPRTMKRLYDAKIPIRRTDLHGRLSSEETSGPAH